jgi:chromosome partitioning protein
MHVISMMNYKGGVGKTTLTGNLAAGLAVGGRSVLMIDVDPQASLTFSFVRPDEWQQKLAASRTIKTWFDSFAMGSPIPLHSLVVAPEQFRSQLRDGGKLDLIASHLGLINVDLELAAELGGASLRQTKMKYLRVHSRLRKALRGAEFTGYDLVVIDCPPNFNVVTKSAIVASDSILIPAKADYLSTLGIDYLHRNLSQLVREFNEYSKVDGDPNAEQISPSVLGVVFTMTQFYGGQAISALRPFIDQTRKLGIPVFDCQLRENKTIFADAPQYGIPVILQSPSGSTYRDVVAELRRFVSEFVAKMGM